jgi:hypothetical protein
MGEKIDPAVKADLQEVAGFYRPACVAMGALLLAFRNSHQDVVTGKRTIKKRFLKNQRDLFRTRERNGVTASAEVLVCQLSEDPCKISCLCAGPNSTARDAIDREYHGISDEWIRSGSDNHED